MKSDTYFVYILTNVFDTVIYVGITNNLERRIIEHREAVDSSFVKRFHAHKLVFYDVYRDALSAIQREKEIKGWRREKKIKLIKTTNPTFTDLLRSVETGEIPHPSASGIRNDS